MAVTQAAKKRLIIAILVGLSGAVVVMIGHHLFQSHLDGKPANTQFWIKTASNAFSQVVALFLGLVASALLTQAAWRALIPDYTQIKIIDAYLSLPSPLSIIPIIRQLKFQSMLPLILTLLIQALLLVSIFAPNSLSINTGPWTNRTAIVPVLDFFDRIPSIATGSNDDSPSRVDTLVLSHLEDYWVPPAGCEISCSIQVQYQAPALACRKLRPDEIEYGAFNNTESFWYFYIGNYSQVSDNWGSPYPGFWINYVASQSGVTGSKTSLDINQTAPADGVQCNFTDGNYQATFGLADGIKSVQTTLISYSQGSVQGCEWASTQSNSLKCSNYSYNANAMSKYFTLDLTRSYYWWLLFGFWVLFPEMNDPILSSYFNLSFTSTTASLNPPVPDVHQVLEQLYFNITLAAMLSTEHTKVGTILASGEKQVWTYAPLTLWVTYGVALGVILIFTIYGIYLVFTQGLAMNNLFLDVVISTRNKGLDSLRGKGAKELKEATMKFNANQLYFEPQEPSIVSQRLLQDKSGQPVNAPSAIGPEDLNNMSPNTKIPPSHTLEPNKWTKILVITAFLASIVLSIAHYLFLWHLNKRDVSQYSQFWIKNASNAFSQVAALCLGFVASHSLTQAIWLAINTRTPISVINRLFALPAPDAYFRLTISPWKLKLIPTVLVVLASYALTLVGIFAPNALTIGTSSQRSISVTVPTFNYSEPYSYDSFLAFGRADSGALVGNLWSKPAGCGPVCQFQFEYEAFGLSCSDFHFSDTVTSSLDEPSWSFITTNSTPVLGGIIWEDTLWRVNVSSLTFWIKFFPSTVQIPSAGHPIVKANSTPVGSLCRYEDMTYRANFLFSNNTVTQSIKPLFDHNSYSTRCPFSWNIEDSPNCDNYPGWSAVISNRFAGWLFNYNNITDVYDIDYLNPPLFLQNIVDFYNNVTGDGTFSLDLKYPNMSEAIVDLYSNYTLGILSDLPYVQTVDAITWGEIVWEFNVATLLSTYIPAHALMLMILVYGFYCMHKNGVLNQDFSTLMMATRDIGSGRLADYAADYDMLLELRLRHEQEGWLVVDDDRQAIEKL